MHRAHTTLFKLLGSTGLCVTVSRLIEAGDPPVAKKVRIDCAVTLWEGKAGGMGRLIVGLEMSSLVEF
ncbi:MAG: hypothetical protein ACRETG_13465 [Steroidobacteraceae bacterium]